ncbi:MAG: hypothetical protein KAW41_06395 [Candidatus Diapherotrites archaeon]|nr:hypothetical protein [Candidatus Diapherotrites archaeon]
MKTYAQGATEYLLIAIAVMGLIAGVLMIINSVLAAPMDQRGVSLDIIECSNAHLQLKQYTEPYDGTTLTAPGSISYYGGIMEKGGTPIPASKVAGEEMCKLQGKFWLRFSPNDRTAWLQTTQTTWLEYKIGGGNGPGPSSIVLSFVGSSRGGTEKGCNGGPTIDVPESTSATITFGTDESFGGPPRTADVGLTLVQAMGVRINGNPVKNCAGCTDIVKSIPVGESKSPVSFTITVDKDGFGQICGSGTGKEPNATVSW